MIEGDKLKGLNRIGLKLATYDRRRETKGSKQNRPKVSYMTWKEIN
jgi:hypothetical protein